MSLIDVDLFDPALYGGSGVPYDAFAVLRREAPVHRHPDPQHPDGFWAVTRHQEVVFVSRHPELFSSHERTAFLPEMEPEVRARQQLMLINLDAQAHSRQRTLVNRGFTPRMVARLRERISAACERIVDRALAVGEGDFVTLCAAELPLEVIADLMGVPPADRHQLFEWTNRLVSDADPGYAGIEDAEAAALEVFAYANSLGAQKRGCPVDDIVTKLVSPGEDGDVLGDLEFNLFFMLLAVAGNETTRSSISGGMLAFHDHPDQWGRLQSDPGLAGTAAEEAVRWVAPVNAFRRTAMADVELGGTRIGRGDKVVVFYGSANRDETVFSDPDSFNIGRDPNPHLGFGGGGPHFCLGRHLARLELETMFATLARTVDRVELTGPVRRLHSTFLNGIVEMPVRLIPRSR